MVWASPGWKGLNTNLFMFEYKAFSSQCFTFRYGRIDSVKILAKHSVDGGQAAFVDFVDIRCAIKAHETPNRLGDRELRTDYNEPASTTLTRSHGEQPRRYERGGRG